MGSKLAPYLSCVTIDVTLFGNKTMKKRTDVWMVAYLGRLLTLSVCEKLRPPERIEDYLLFFCITVQRSLS